MSALTGRLRWPSSSERNSFEVRASRSVEAPTRPLSHLAAACVAVVLAVGIDVSACV